MHLFTDLKNYHCICDVKPYVVQEGAVQNRFKLISDVSRGGIGWAKE